MRKGRGCQDKHLRCNTLPLPASGSREPTGASLTEAWVASRDNAVVVAAWVVLVLQLILEFVFFLFSIANFSLFEMWYHPLTTPPAVLFSYNDNNICISHILPC